MRVLFVSSGNRGVSPLIKAQAQSLVNIGIQIEFYPIIGKGLFGYLKNIPKLRRYLRSNNHDIIHAHYSFCGIIAALSTKKPIVTSLMGSDVLHSWIWRWIIVFFAQHVWAVTIVKSEDMKKKIGVASVNVIPNGVDLEKFKPFDKSQCRQQVGWSDSKKIILFAADPLRKEKNYKLARRAVDNLNRDDVELKVVHSIAQVNLPFYYNSADLLLVTSRWEGSPNVVKEAMACDLPVVSTKVGDVQFLFGSTEGYFTSDPDPDSICRLIIMILGEDLKPHGRIRIQALGLDSDSLAYKINDIYQSLR